MNIREFYDISESLTWSKSGNNIVRKYRCTNGPRKGRLVSKMSQCFVPVDIKKRMDLKKTKAKFGSRLAKKAKKTKKTNPVSRNAKRMNRR